MRKFLVLISFLLLLPASAQAQSGCTGQAPANTYCGNNSVSQGLPGFHTLTPGSIILNGGSVLANTGTSAAVGTSSSNPVLGIPGTSTGTISFAGISGGTVLVTPQSTAGSPTLTLPNTSGTFAVNASSPLVLSLTTGALTCPTCVTGAGGALINGTTPTSGYSNTQILSSNGTVLSAYSVSGTGNVILATNGALTTPSITTPTIHTSLLVAGLSTGTVTIVPQSAAGTPTITLPTTTGTLADSATAPIVLSATTGVLTCPTCVTSSGGGAITGQAPVAVSAAGVVSITGAAGQVLAGATPAFTATPVLGVAGTTVGSIGFQNASTGTETITPATGALGSGIATLPAGTYNIVGDSLTQALTNKTYSGGAVSGTFTGNTTFSGNITHSGQLIETGISAPSSAAGNTVVMGTIAAPTLTNTGQAFFYNTTVNGAVVEGDGSTYDVALANKSGSVALGIATGTTTPVLPGLSSGTCTNGLAINSSNQIITAACPGAASSIQVGVTSVTSTTANTLLGSGTVTAGTGTLANVGAGPGITITSSTISSSSAPYAKVYLAASQSNGGSIAKINFDTVDNDPNSIWSATNHNFNPQVAGRYEICGAMFAGGSTVTFAQIEFSRNGLSGGGGTTVGAISAGQINNSVFGCTTLALNGSTDTVEIDGTITGTGTVVFTGSANQITYATIKRIGP